MTTTSARPATAPSVERILADPRAKDMQRAARREAIDEKARTVEFSFASEQPVERWFGLETLSFEGTACDLTRLNNSGACLVNHDWDDQVGVVVRAWIDKREQKARCIVKFSRSTRGQEIFQDIVDGVRELVSTAYIVRKMQMIEQRDGLESFLVTDFQPFEVSIVAVPADVSVGVHRSLNPQAQISVSTSPTPAANHAVEIIQSAGVLKARHPNHRTAIDTAVEKFAGDGGTADAFGRYVAEHILATRDERSPGGLRQTDAGTVGLNKRDVARYSILRAAQSVIDGRQLDGLERECNDELTRKLGRRPEGFFLPDEVGGTFKRTLLATSPLDGGYTVGSEVLASETMPLLRNASRILELGARVISGLQGNISIPRQLTGSSAYWVSETGAVTATSATFGQVVGRPRALGAQVQYTKQFLAQTSLDAESFVRGDMQAAAGVELDRVAINGTGGAEPLGILNLATADLGGTVTFSAAPTWAKYLEFESDLETANSLIGSPAYITSPASKLKARTIARFTNGSVPIWTDDGKVGEYRARSTNQLPSGDKVIFGDFGQVLILEWAGADMIVDPYTSAATGIVIMTTRRLVDVVVRQAKSFNVSTDSGAQ